MQAAPSWFSGLRGRCAVNRTLDDAQQAMPIHGKGASRLGYAFSHRCRADGIAVIVGDVALLAQTVKHHHGLGGGSKLAIAHCITHL